MKVKVFETLETFEEFNFNVNNIKDIFTGIKMLKGEEYLDNILNTGYKYLLQDSTGINTPVTLNEDVFMSVIEGYDELYLLPDITGELPAAAATAIWAASMTALTEIGVGATMAGILAEGAVMVASTLVYAGLSMALNGIMQALSPTTSFSNDPAASQQKQSSLFNGAPVIREQGGSVPLWYGESYAGGVLISSSLSTAEG